MTNKKTFKCIAHFGYGGTSRDISSKRCFKRITHLVKGGVYEKILLELFLIEQGVFRMYNII